MSKGIYCQQSMTRPLSQECPVLGGLIYKIPLFTVFAGYELLRFDLIGLLLEELICGC